MGRIEGPYSALRLVLNFNNSCVDASARGNRAIDVAYGLTPTAAYLLKTTSQPTNQPTSQPTNQPNQPTNKTTNQPTNQTTNQSINQPTKQATKQRAN
jgi:hypothetical protein